MTFGDLRKLRTQRDRQETPDQTTKAEPVAQGEEMHAPKAATLPAEQSPTPEDLARNAPTTESPLDETGTPEPSEQPAERSTSRRPRQPVEPTTLETRMLAARISHAYARELERSLLNATEYIPRVTKEEAIPALIRLLRDPGTFDRWLDEIETVRSERQTSRPR